MIFFHIYSKIVAVFLTMALLFRCLLAYRLKKSLPVRPASFFYLLPSFHLSTSDSRAERFFLTGSTKYTIEGGWSHSFVSLVFPKFKVNRK